MRETETMTDGNSLGTMKDMIISKRARIGIFGAGYVGLPLACAFAQAGFATIAGDSDPEKVRAIRSGISYVEDDFVSSCLPSLVSSGTLEADSDTARIASLVDFAIITVPTPLSDRKEPDLSYVTRVAETISKEIRRGKFVILESSVYPGTTEEVVKPILEKGGLKAGRDFGLAHSPERIDYNNRRYGVLDIPKVVGGVTPLCTQIACELYRSILRARVVPVSNTRTAEATKMLENTYRFVNIALVNELSTFFEKFGLDSFEVISAAATKPFGFQAFYPGPGVGGHCIPKDPQYLAYKARQVGVRLRLVELSAEINDGMVDHTIGRLEENLAKQGRSISGSKAVVLGLAFKADVSDSRRSPSIALIERLADRGTHVEAYDPLVRSVRTKRGEFRSAESLEKCVEGADILVLATPHAVFRDIDLKKLCTRMHPNPLMVDTRGFWSRAECESAGFDYLGLGRP
jgi:nucleotide sugar dehydrogenase